MTQHGCQDEMQIRAALIARLPDDPARVADLPRTLRAQKDLELTTLGYKPRSVFSPNFRHYITGLSMIGPAADQFIESEHGETQVYCREIWRHLPGLLRKGTSLQISHIRGWPHGVASK
jgi:hypothetical protein